MTYQTTIAQQRNFDFFVFFSALYLVVSDILLKRQGDLQSSMERGLAFRKQAEYNNSTKTDL